MPANPKLTCSTPGCNRPAPYTKYGRHCKPCYTRHRRHADPVYRRRIADQARARRHAKNPESATRRLTFETVEELLKWTKPAPPLNRRTDIGDCRVWTRGLTGEGYARGVYQGKRQRLHKAVYEAAHGIVAPGFFVCHRCDTPACIRLDHLKLGTPGENSADRVRRNRNWMFGPKLRLAAQKMSKGGEPLTLAEAAERLAALWLDGA